MSVTYLRPNVAIGCRWFAADEPADANDTDRCVDPSVRTRRSRNSPLNRTRRTDRDATVVGATTNRRPCT